MSKGLKSADAINAAYAQAEREWSSQEQDAIKANRDSNLDKCA